jgi:hypothetical protein
MAKLAMPIKSFRTVLCFLLGLPFAVSPNLAFADSKAVAGGKSTQSIFVKSPKAGAVFAPGSDIEVRWTVLNVKYVDIYISKGNKIIARLGENVLAVKQSHKATIPKWIEPNPDTTKFSYYLEITSGVAAVRDKVMIVIK